MEAALITLKKRQRDCVWMFASTVTLSVVPGRNSAMQHPHYQQELIGKNPGAGVNILCFKQIIFYSLHL